ncbi:MAG: patatin-like phospholipase family protein [Planctomycetaceae bacterium]|nr:patatin-like phospholipase family protein [Planctomycetaceae bacterium]
MLDFNVLLLSGGTRVPVHVGAVKALEEGGARVAAWAGVSGGSLVASIFACGYSSDEAAELMYKTDYRQLLDPSPVSLVRRLGLYAGHRLERWLDRVFDGRRFRDLKVPLSVLATDVATGAPFVFSKDRTPDLKLSTAVRCSMSLPGIFAIPYVEGRALIDGGFTASSPKLLFPENQQTNLVIRMEESDRGHGDGARISSRRGYVFHVANLILRNLKPLSHPELWDYHVRIPVGTSTSLKFDLSQEEKKDLFQRGHRACRDALANAILDIAGSDFADAFVLGDELSSSDTSDCIDATAVLRWTGTT